MDKKKLIGKIIGTIIGVALLGWGISIIVRHVNDTHPFMFLLSLIPMTIGFLVVLATWLPLSKWPSGPSRVNTAEDERRAERKAQRKAERDLFLAAMLVDDAIRSKNKDKNKKENVWEDNSEDNDFDDEE